MSNKIIGAVFFILFTAGIWVLNSFTPLYDLSNAVKSLVAITITYCFFKIVLRLLIDRNVKERKAVHYLEG